MRSLLARLAAGTAAAGGVAAVAVAGVRSRRARVAGRAIGGTDPGETLPQLVAGVEAAGVRLPGPSLDVGDVYREARRAFGRAAREPADDAFGELLERSLALWCALSFAEPFGGKETKRLARGTRALTELLRERQEVAALVGSALAMNGALGRTGRARLAAFGERRRDRLERQIVEQGRELFAVKPGRLAHRLADERG